jgi:hypothetical protein
LAWAVIDHTCQSQTLSLAYFDCFYVFAILSACLIPLVALLRKSVAAAQHGH